MALTPEDVSNKRFTTVRLREGYDMTEVDQFLDEVEAELERITRENDELRTKLQAAQNGEPMPETSPEPAPEKVEEAPAPEPETSSGDTSNEEYEGEHEGEHEGAPAVESHREAIKVTTTAEASTWATRMLELAGQNADELVSEARQEADKIVADARATAERLETESRSRAEALEAETAERRQSLFGDIDKEKQELDAEVQNLRAFEREYRAELRTYFEEQLAALDGQGAGGVLGRSTEGGEVQSGASASGQSNGQSNGQSGDQSGDQSSALQSVLDEDEKEQGEG